MKTQEIREYWNNAMALGAQSIFANLERYLIESGNEGLNLLNENYKLLSPVLDVQKLILAMKAKKAVIENKKYFLKLATKEMAKAHRTLQGKFDQTYRLLVQLGFDVKEWTMDNFFEKLEEMERKEQELPDADPNLPDTTTKVEQPVKAKITRKKKEEIKTTEDTNTI